MFGISLARISLLTGTSLGGGVGVSPTLDLNFRGQGYSAAMAGYTFNQLIDFTRTSAATYVDATGKIVSTPASRNLLTYTQEFDNAGWTKNNVTITANSTAAPDGTMTADTLDEGTATANHAMFSGAATLVSGLNYAASIYLKAGSARWVQIPLLSATFGSNAWANFDLVGGVVGNTGSAVVSATITSAGNGWYRCVVVAPATASGSGASLQVGFTDNANSATRLPSYTGSSKTVFAWGAQLEQASAATDYTRNFGGVYPPRFDYDPVTLAPRGLLVEEQRTNLLLRSEDFTTSWGAVSTTVTANTDVSPDGTTNADTLTPSTTSSYVWQNATFTGDGDKACSVFLKAGTSTTTRLILRDTTATVNRGSVDITWTAGVPSGVATVGTLQGIDSFGSGWYRVRMLATGVVAANTNQFRFSPDPIAGTGTSIMWGAQTENGAFATSYIPTVDSQVTRSADVATITGANFSQWYNQSEGTFVVEVDSFAPTDTAVRFAVAAADSPTTSRNTVFLYNGKWGASARISGTDQCDLQQSGSYTANATAKIAFAYKANDFAASVNGLAVLTDTSGAIPAVDRLLIAGNGPSNILNGHIRSIRYYPTRLSNAQLQALTA